MIGFGKRISYATRCFFSVLSRGEVPEDIAPEVAPSTAAPEPHRATETPALPAEQPAPAEDSGDRAVQLLALLQRDGRLVDFLCEEIAPYQDA